MVGGVAERRNSREKESEDQMVGVAGRKTSREKDKEQQNREDEEQQGGGATER